MGYWTTKHTSSHRREKPVTQVFFFADAQRRHPCEMSTDMKRKDRVQHHLQQVIVDGYDDSHPRDDPLWQSVLVAKYYLKSRPQKFNPNKSKTQVSKYNAVYYQEKKTALRERGEMMKQQYEDGTITAEQNTKCFLWVTNELFSRDLSLLFPLPP
jgi:hypothetical protein